MINKTLDSVSFFYPYNLLIKELNMLSSYKAGDDIEMLKAIEVSEDNKDVITNILKQIVPVIYQVFIRNSVNVENGMIVNHDAVTIKIDRHKNTDGESVLSDNRLLLIDGLLKNYIVKHTLAEWILLRISNADLFQSIIKDDESLLLSLHENLQLLNNPFRQISYIVTEIE